MHTISVQNQYFLDETIEFTWVPLRLEIINTTDGSGMLRELVVALANTMLGYTDKCFCGIFNARVSNLRTHAAVNVWASLRIV